jgi:hypothetical protein
MPAQAEARMMILPSGTVFVLVTHATLISACGTVVQATGYTRAG